MKTLSSSSRLKKEKKISFELELQITESYYLYEEQRKIRRKKSIYTLLK